MPLLIKNGSVQEDGWQGPLLSLEALNEQAAASTTGLAVQLEPDQPPSAIEADLNRIDMVAVNFPVFTDGRGFSYARELRELGFTGEIRAVGHFIRDQLHYLQRCGFTAFQFDDQQDLEACLASLNDFSDGYQADVLEREPLFRRR